jgi:hypothetical protein
MTESSPRLGVDAAPRPADNLQIRLIMTRQQIRRAKRATAHVLREAVLVVIALMAVMAFAG